MLAVLHFALAGFSWRATNAVHRYDMMLDVAVAASEVFPHSRRRSDAFSPQPGYLNCAATLLARDNPGVQRIA